MVMLNMIRFVRVAQRHADSFHLGFAEVLEQERFDSVVSFDALVQVATPPVGTQLASPKNKDIAAHNFHPFHESHLLNSKWPWLPGGHEHKFFSTIQSILLMPKTTKPPESKGFLLPRRHAGEATAPAASGEGSPLGS